MKHVIRLTRRSRVHIPVGSLAWGIFSALFILMYAAAAIPVYGVNRHIEPVANATAAAPLKLIIANGGGYKTNIKLNADADASVTLDSCQQGGVLYLHANGSRYYEDAGSFLCPGPAFRLLDVPAGVRARTDFSYQNGAVRTSFNADPIGAVTVASPSTIGHGEALVNNGARVVYVLCGFTDSEGTLAVDLFGPDAQPLGTEIVQCVGAGGIPTLQPLSKKFQSGYVVVRNISAGYPGFGATVYGAIVNSAPDNSNARVYGFGQ